MANEEWLGPQYKACRQCGTPIHQAGGWGRIREFCSDACKMKAYRGRKSSCLNCGRTETLPANPYTGQTCTCWQCKTVMRYKREPNSGKRSWVITKRGRRVKA